VGGGSGPACNKGGGGKTCHGHLKEKPIEVGGQLGGGGPQDNSRERLVRGTWCLQGVQSGTTPAPSPARSGPVPPEVKSQVVRVWGEGDGKVEGAVRTGKKKWGRMASNATGLILASEDFKKKRNPKKRAQFSAGLNQQKGEGKRLVKIKKTLERQCRKGNQPAIRVPQPQNDKKS